LGRAQSNKLKDLIRNVEYKKKKAAKNEQSMTRSEKDKANGLVLQYSFYDNAEIKGEICYTQDFAPTVYKKLTETFGFVPQFAVEHDFGEVLNSQ
jgi:hypothetical protein